MRLFTVTALLALSTALTGCKQTVIQGQVLDAFGAPISDAEVSVQGTEFTARSNAVGKYSVGYVPGKLTVSVSKPGYTATEFETTIATESTFPAAPVTLYEIPKSPEIFAIYGGNYLPLGRASVTARTTTTSKWFTTTESTMYSAEYADTTSIPSLKAQDAPLVFIDNDSNQSASEPDPGKYTLFEIHCVQHSCSLLRRIVRNGDMGFAMRDFSDNASTVQETHTYYREGVMLRSALLQPGTFAFAPYRKNSRVPFLPGGPVFVFRVEGQ